MAKVCKYKTSLLECGTYYNMSNIHSIRDSWGDEIGATMIDQLMIAESHRLSGGVFNGTTLDSNFYISTTTANGAATISGNVLDLSVTTDSGSSIKAHTQSLARYIGANMNSFRMIARFGDTGVVNNKRQFGVINGNGYGVISNFTDGFFFQLSGTTFSIVARTGSSDTVVNSGSFNGDVTSWTVDTNFHTFEIFYTNKKIQFFIDKIFIHEFIETNSVLSNTRHFKPFGSNINTGITSAAHLYCQVITISLHGSNATQAKTYLQQGTTAGVLLKNGPGAIHLLNVSGVVNNSVVTIYDGTTTGGRVIWTSGTMSNQTVPFGLSLDSNGGTPFEDGLYLTITGANSNAFIKYE